MKKKRICCFCESWESGGIESFLCNMLLHMDLSGMEVDIVAARVDASVFTEPLRAAGVRFVELSGRLRSPKNGGKFRQLLRERRYDVIHFNLFQGLSLHYVHIAKEESVPVRIAHSHNTALRKCLTRPLKLLLHRLGSSLFTESATHLWACSGEAANFLFSPRDLQKIGFTFIPNGIRLERFRFDPAARNALRAQLGWSDCFVVGSVGRLCAQKNQTFLLDVFAEMIRSRPDCRLLLIGEGEDRAALEHKANQLGVADKVTFYGVTQTVEQLYCAMDVFVFPSLFEGLGIAAVEAQTCGLPVLCSEHIPPEAHLTDLAHPLSLSSGARTWAAKALSMCANTTDRTQAADAVKAAGFDVTDAARRIEQFYLGE